MFRLLHDGDILKQGMEWALNMEELVLLSREWVLIKMFIEIMPKMKFESQETEIC